MTDKTPIAILLSGRGSNMQSLVRAAEAADYPARVVLVASDKPDAPGLAFAAAQGIATLALDRGSARGRGSFDAAIHAAATEAGAERICLAGFMRILGPRVLTPWQGRILNVHPSLLPLYPGLDTHARALADGVKLHGCTVHHVTEGIDEGPIIAQAAVPVMAGDTPESLAARVLKAEHRIYPAALAAHLTGRAETASDAVLFSIPA